MGERRTSPVELLWDLVFVFSITEVSVLLGHHLSWGGAGRALIVLALIWWAWSAFVWAANAHDTDSPTLQAALLRGPRADLRRRAGRATHVRERGDAVRMHLRRRALPASRAVRGRLAPRERGVERDRRLRGHGHGRDGAAGRRLVPRHDLAHAAVGGRGGDRLRRAGVADARAPARTAAGRGGALRRALRPLRDHLPRRVDHLDRRRRERAAPRRAARRRAGLRPRHHGRRCGGRTSTVSPRRASAACACTTTPCSRPPTRTPICTS